MCLISPRYIKKEERVRIGGALDRTRTIGEEIGGLVENEVIIVIEKTGDLGDSPDQEKEE